MRRRKGLPHKVDLVVLTLLCITLGALIPFVLSNGYKVSMPGWLASINLGIIVLGFVFAACCYVMMRALVAVRYREGRMHYIEIGVRMLMCAPLGALLTFPLTFQYDIPTPGGYAMWQCAQLTGGGLGALLPALFVGGFVNVFCCYVIIRVLVAIVAGLRGKKDPAAPGKQELN